MLLKDNFGRPLLNLRVAVTKRCDLNCSYCHGEGDLNNTGGAQIEMTCEEIVRIVSVAVTLGVSKVKLTGGEPLMRKDIVDIVQGIARTPGLTDLSMTTNGTMLAHTAEELHFHGLNRVNVSLPSLRSEVYHKLTNGRLEDALRGVEAAINAGLWPVKLNMLVLNGINDCDVQSMIEFAEKTSAILQLIELEPINISNEFYSVHHKPLGAYESMLKGKAVKTQKRTYMQNRCVYDLSNMKVEVVHPIENTEFCSYCSRLRVTSEGKLKPCLMRNDNLLDILGLLRSGASDRELADLFKVANARRQPYNR